MTKSSGQAARTGSWKAWLNGFGSANTEFVWQSVAIPATASSATLGFWLRVVSSDLVFKPVTGGGYDLNSDGLADAKSIHRRP